MPDIIEKKRNVYRCSIFGTLILLIISGIYTISPIIRHNYILPGTCEITSLTWPGLQCGEGNQMQEYYVPVISAVFYLNLTDSEEYTEEYTEEYQKMDNITETANITETDYNEELVNSTEIENGTSFMGLFVNEHKEDKTTGLKATIFDDGSESALIQCEWPNIQYVINQLLAEYIPSLTVNGSEFDEFSFDRSNLTNYTVLNVFPCTHDSRKDVFYITYETVPRYGLAMLFFVVLAFHFTIAFLLLKYENETESPLGVIALLSLAGVFIAHHVLYNIFTVLLRCMQVEVDYQPDAAFQNGSIFYPLICLVEAIVETCCNCGCPSSEPPPPAPPAPPVATSIGVQVQDPQISSNGFQAASAWPDVPREGSQTPSVREGSQTPSSEGDDGATSHHSVPVPPATAPSPMTPPPAPSAPSHPSVFSSPDAPPTYADLIFRNYGAEDYGVENYSGVENYGVDMPPYGVDMPPSYDEVMEDRPE